MVSQNSSEFVTTPFAKTSFEFLIILLYWASSVHHSTTHQRAQIQVQYARGVRTRLGLFKRRT
jgi:hypothetical protein